MMTRTFQSLAGRPCGWLGVELRHAASRHAPTDRTSRPIALPNDRRNMTLRPAGDLATLLKLFDRHIVEIEPEVPRPKDLDALRCSPQRGRGPADDHDFFADFVAAQLLGRHRVPVLG